MKVPLYYISSAFINEGLLGDIEGELVLTYLEEQLRRSKSKKKIIHYRATVSTIEKATVNNKQRYLYIQSKQTNSCFAAKTY